MTIGDMHRGIQRALAALFGSAALLLGHAGHAAAMSCSIQGSSDMAFGTYSPTARRPLDAVAFFSFICDDVRGNDMVYIEISRSMTGAYLPRTMTGPDPGFEYNLYLNAGRTQVWGDGSAGTNVYRTRPHNGRTMSVPIYGRIAPRQSVRTGVYSDTVVVTMMF